MGRRREFDWEFFDLVENPRGPPRPEADPEQGGDADPGRAQRRERVTCERCGSSTDVTLVTYLRSDVEVTAHLCALCKARRLRRVRLGEEPKERPWAAKGLLRRRRRGRS